MRDKRSECSTTSIQELTQLKCTATIFPNPFSIDATLKTERELRNGDLKIYDYAGKEIKAYNNINRKEILIERGNLASGIYSYQLIEERNIIAKEHLEVQ